MSVINNNLNILIFPAGGGCSKEIFDSLKYIRWINIFGAVDNINNLAFYEYKHLFLDAPFLTDPDKLISYLNNLIEKYNIHCIYPAFDNIILFLKKHENMLNTKIICSPYETCEICISKSKTYELLNEFISVPKIFKSNEITKFPVFIKPDNGYGSRNSYKIHNKEELKFYTEKLYNIIICNYLPGNEYTVDCFTSKENGLLFCEARIREKVVNGASVLTKHVDLPEIKNMGKIINNKMKFIGAWFFQVKYNDENKLTLLEIAPRIPGAAALHRGLGYNGPLLSIYEHFDNTIDNIKLNKYNISCYKSIINRYNTNIKYNTVYIDLDDTIIIKDKVNTNIISFLYDCVNNNKKIILLTRNSNPQNILNNYKISLDLFDDIISIPNRSIKKSAYIKEKSSIFIDDSYTERDDVYKINNINIFNCDNIDLLYNETF